MRLQVGLRGSIADDYARSNYKDIHEFLVLVKNQEPLSRVWKEDRILFCYTREQESELPDAIPYPL